MRTKTVIEQMNAEKPDDVIADLEAKHGSVQRVVSPLPCPFCGGGDKSVHAQGSR